MHVRSPGFYRYAERIFGLVVGERSPGSRVLGEDNRPFFGVWDHVQSICSLVERLAFDHDRIAEGDRSVLIRARTPDLAVRNQTVPNLAILYHRPVIVDGDIGNPNFLRNLCPLALVRQIEYERLRQTYARHGCHQQAETES